MYKPETIKASVFIPKKLNRKLKKMATLSSMTKSGLIVKILTTAIEQAEIRTNKSL